MQKVTCIIVTYNASKWIFDCLVSIKEPNIDLQIVVVDNNSKDDTLEIIANNFPNVQVFPQSINLGFGAANNMGFEKAKEYGSEYIYLLNQDTISYEDNIYKLINLDLHSGERNGFVSPTHLNDEGDKLDKLFESFINSNTCPYIISDLFLSQKKDLYEIEFSNAAAWLLKVSTVKNLGGLFSKAFFHYGEDNNFVSRLKFFGYKNFIAPNIFIHHCREVRRGKLGGDFHSKRFIISAIVKMHDINYSYSANSIFVFKKSLVLIRKYSFLLGLKLLVYPIFSFKSINEARKSYLTQEIL